MLSVVIPSRNIPEWKFTQKTVTDLFEKATGDVEVIVVLDGYELNPHLIPRENLTVIHNPVSLGMRPAINAGIAIAKGKYICKCDDHCMFGEGYDKILAADCDENWLVVPSRYSLDGENWSWKIKGGRPYGPIDYLYLTYPLVKSSQFGYGFHGQKWRGERGITGGYFEREEKLKHILIDDMLTCQGSCWFTTKQHFNNIGGMQYEGYIDHQEAQEMTFKTFLSGGRVVVNKKTYYCHLHKGNQHGRGYRLFRHKMIKSQIYSADYWLNNRWPLQTRKLKSYIEHPSWWPLEGWEEDWDNPKKWENYDYSSWLKE